MSAVWVCKPENYESTLILKEISPPVSFSFDLYSDRGFTFQSTIPPLDLIERIEVAALSPSDVEVVRIMDGSLLVWEGRGSCDFKVEIPTHNSFLQLEVRYSRTFQIAPIFCWVRVTMRYRCEEKLSST
jgi:hypothetical protein